MKEVFGIQAKKYLAVTCECHKAFLVDEKDVLDSAENGVAELVCPWCELTVPWSVKTLLETSPVHSVKTLE